MTISTHDQMVNALMNNASRLVIDKTSVVTTAAGQIFSMWRATGQPAQAAIPTTAAVPTNATLGAFAFDQQTSPNTSYFGWALVSASNQNMGVEFHDRIAHFGGLVLNVTTAQTVTGLDLLTLAPSAARRGAANYSDVQWFLEVYADGGATASNATINVTYDDGSTGNLNAVAVGGTLRNGRLLPLTPAIPVAQQGRFIRGINSVTLSASTTVAGNFGFTCSRQRTGFGLPTANVAVDRDYVQLGAPEIPNESCIFMVAVCAGTSTHILRGQGKIAHG
jgi:hypothetical protein